ncbi:MAG TPA: OsmC family protein [Nitrospirota bacterium]|nr:OsmC family protein [Nitrospirota bacterium]
MSEEMEIKELEGALDVYKSRVSQVNKATLTWDKDLIFVGRTNRGYEVEFDAEQQWGCSPTETLLLSVAGCMGIDMVSFLKKMKCEIKSYKMDIVGERNPTPPQYYTAMEMIIAVSGSGLTAKKLERAISLSHEKYCSVYHTLRKDMKMKVDYAFENV